MCLIGYNKHVFIWIRIKDKNKAIKAESGKPQYKHRHLTSMLVKIMEYFVSKQKKWASEKAKFILNLVQTPLVKSEIKTKKKQPNLTKCQFAPPRKTENRKYLREAVSLYLQVFKIYS